MMFDVAVFAGAWEVIPVDAKILMPRVGLNFFWSSIKLQVRVQVQYRKHSCSLLASPPTAASSLYVLSSCLQPFEYPNALRDATMGSAAKVWMPVSIARF